MAPSIDLDDHNFERLQRLATPLVDTANSVVGRLIDAYLEVQRASKHSAPKPVSPPVQSAAKARSRNGKRPKLNESKLRDLGVSHFAVGGAVNDYKGVRAHPRAYLDAMIASGKWPGPYFEAWNEAGLPNPRGDAAARVILQVGEKDSESRVHFHNGRPDMPISEFIKAFLQGNL